MTKSGIYKITNKVNGKFYIGSSIDIKKRWWKHKWLLESKRHKNQYLQSAWDKYGEENFVFSVLLETKEELLLEKEQELLDKTKCYNKEVGYNIAKDAVASMRGKKHSAHTKSKISSTLTGRTFSKETRQRMSEACKGRKHTEETRRKISEAQIGVPHSKETKRKMSKANKRFTDEEESSFRKRWESGESKSSIARSVGTSPTAICRAIKRAIKYNY